MARNFVIITDHLENDLEDYLTDALEGDEAALKVIVDYTHSLRAAAESLPTAAQAQELVDELQPILNWIEAGADVEDFDGDSEDESDFFETVGYGLSSASNYLGELMIPLSGEGYDSEMILGRVVIEQIPPYDSGRPQATLAGVTYSFVNVPSVSR